MARTTKKKEAVKETATVVTRAEKKDATKNLIREILAVKPLKHNELIDEVAKSYVERFGDTTDNINDVKGRVGSVLDIMKKESDVMYEGGMYALKARMPIVEPIAESAPALEVETEPALVAEEKPAPKKRGRKPKAKAEETASPEIAAPVEEAKEKEPEEKAEPLPPAPLQPIAPVAPITPEVAPEPIPEDKPAPKKRGRKPKAKAEEIAPVEETPVAPIEEAKEAEETPMVEMTAEETPAPAPVEVPVVEKVTPVVEEKVEEAPKAVEKKETEEKPVMDMSFLFGDIKPQKAQEREDTPSGSPKARQLPRGGSQEKAETKPEEKAEVKSEEKQAEKPAQKEKAEKRPAQKTETKPAEKAPAAAKTSPAPKATRAAKEAPRALTNARKLPVRGAKKALERPLTADEKLREAFLKKIRSLGGDYFEYYSVYLLERYSMKNGRRLEGMKISGGDHDGGIDGEIELTDKLGFKETIYIQSKNWNPEKGDEKLWVVGETLLQQFIGACACRQAKDGKQNCRGIFITTSRFTPEAKRILEDMSDKIVGYDGNDLYEAAKECSFGVIEKNGEWALDERLLAGSKAFFNWY